jgi:hypothetical protein
MSPLLGPFPPEFFDNEIVLHSFSEVTNDQGGVVDTWDPEGVTSPASVQAQSVNMADPQGRVVVSTQYSVFTPTDIAAKARDEIAWRNRKLTPQGPTIDEGGCGVLWKTTCTETT